MPRATRQPVHTVYGGAHLFKADTARKLGVLALAQLDEYAPDAATLADALGWARDPTLDSAVAVVYRRLRQKLQTDAVEDLRIDFEDGYGHRSDAEEDAHAEAAAREATAAHEAGALPPFFGIRVKAFAPATRARAERTLDRFCTTLLNRDVGRLPSGFVVTLPKVTEPEEVAALSQAVDRIERRHGLELGAIPLELMIETPEAIIARDGRIAIPAFIAAGGGRVRGCHFGTYDFTAACHVSAAHQTMDHPLADFALGVMQVALAPTSVAMSDGATTLLPIPPHRATAVEPLAATELSHNRSVVHAAWRLACDNVTRALVRGIYQGWDLHPGQLVPRYAAVFRFFRTSLPEVTRRLRVFAASAARATRSGAAFDDAATGLALRNHLVRALQCGALDEADIATSGVTREDLLAEDFIEILSNRATE